MAHKRFKLVQKQRQTEKERNKNIQHTTQEEELVGGGPPLVPKIWDQSDRVCAKSPIFALFSLVAPQP